MKSTVKKASFCFVLALLLLAWPLVPAARAEAVGQEVTDRCTYILPENVPVDRLTDDSLLTRLTVYSRKALSVSIPPCEAPCLYVTWFALPQAVTLTQADGEGHHKAS